MKGVLLKGKFEDGEEIFMEVMQGMEHHYWDSAVLMLLKSISRLKQAAMLFWQKLLKIMKNMGHTHSIADPCMFFFRNNAGEFLLLLSWVDDNLLVVILDVVKVKGKKITREFEIDDVSELKEFIRCKVEINKSVRLAKFTQPVMIQSFQNEFGTGKKKHVAPPEMITMLKKLEPDKILANKDQSKY